MIMILLVLFLAGLNIFVDFIIWIASEDGIFTTNKLRYFYTDPTTGIRRPCKNQRII